MSESKSLLTARRNFLKNSAAIGALALGAKAAEAADSCRSTPKQSLGPFYPGEKNFGADLDLTWVPGRPARALGKIVYVTGKVLDAECRPLENANVEIWQACASGRYNHDRDPNSAPLDPNFRYWSEAFTNKNGEYLFKTIIPGAYPADTDWIRPPHIHFRITKLGYKELVTQMYFAGESLNDTDHLLNQVPPSERKALVVNFQPSGPDLEPGTLIGSFNITLSRVR